MNINKIHRLAGYLAIPAVSVGILGGAAIGLAGAAAAEAEHPQPVIAGELATIDSPSGELASVSDPTATRASVSDPTATRASVSDPTATRASVQKPKASERLASVSDPAGKRA